MSFNFGSNKTKTHETAKQDPWAPTVPLLKNFLDEIPTQATGPDQVQKQAFGQLGMIAKNGDPNAAAIGQLSRDQLGYDSTAPMAQEGYADYTRRLTPIADGANQDFTNDPYIQDLLKMVGDDAANRNRAAFAAAGRDGSGYDMQTTARGVGQAQLPILFDQMNRERARSDAAAGSLYGAANTSAETIQGLDLAALDARAKGVETSKDALEAKAWGPTQLLNLREQMKNMKYDELAKIAELLYPAAGLGKQTEGEKKGKSTSMGFGLKLI